MTDLSCDVAMIGAGTAGLAAERTAWKTGAKTLLIDDRFAGTTCASVGCMRSKLLIAAADAAHGVRKASTFGIPKPTVDGRAVMSRLRKERDGSRKPSRYRRMWCTSRADLFRREPAPAEAASV